MHGSCGRWVSRVRTQTRQGRCGAPPNAAHLATGGAGCLEVLDWVSRAAEGRTRALTPPHRPMCLEECERESLAVKTAAVGKGIQVCTRTRLKTSNADAACAERAEPTAVANCNTKADICCRQGYTLIAKVCKGVGSSKLSGIAVSTTQWYKWGWTRGDTTGAVGGSASIMPAFMVQHKAT